MNWAVTTVAVCFILFSSEPLRQNAFSWLQICSGIILYIKLTRNRNAMKFFSHHFFHVAMIGIAHVYVSTCILHRTPCIRDQNFPNNYTTSGQITATAQNAHARRAVQPICYTKTCFTRLSTSFAYGYRNVARQWWFSPSSQISSTTLDHKTRTSMPSRTRM